MKTPTSAIALLPALALGASDAVLAADAPGGVPAAGKTKQTLEEGCKEHDGTWASRGRQGGICTVNQDPAAKKKKQTLE
jgi:hypothetical protein